VASILRTSSVLSWVRAGGGEKLVQIEHGLHKLNHAIVAGDIGGIDEVDG